MIDYLKAHGEATLLLIAAITGILLGISQLFPEMGTPQQIFLLATLIFWIAALAWCLFKAEFPFFRRYKAGIALVLLTAYALVLAVATISEVFELGWFGWL
ncbi:MAG TPA: hypothetical protein PK636_06455 [bacterium]|nr:hypothetical protein [bacterium]HPJ72305.1 hypothetical protein [bacterium]HPQ65863.1 hypothetical protein [bacterium]